MLKRDDVQRSVDLLSGASRIVTMCHSNPDGDAIGSLLGITLLLEQQLPHVPIQCVCKDPTPETLQFLPGTSRIVHNLLPCEGDVYVFLDSAEPKLTGFHEQYPQVFDASLPSISIDHHPTNSHFAQINLIDATAASACEIVVEFADNVSWNISPDIATCLLTGVYTDTGGLLHSNTSVQVYRTVARLLRSGARQQEIVKRVFRTAKLSTLKLWGRVLEKISLTDEGGAITAVTRGDFAATGADYSELTGAIDYVNAVPGMRFSMILSERDGKVKGSLRTLRDDVDVSAMAGKFDGGGHKKAAGFALPGKLKPEVRWKVVHD
ncbi:MAG: bifunctional oligoribonuclease/PAP phosphatase NrnA [Candidatus Peregrinibacteria bacterium]|nr:bifunctional oligoribonuclease/PAP phosphatase NrnA [Candidatus Peregrinibacteria bacterium]MCB9808305.1 bifunctional oligoribonuclease/PAP phosphatase NrnA [Candidatus Peribacteria bacterium]